ncbi:metallohydrolase [Solimonas marina]|uniref:Metallohydrolase n=1 Tax=Solimonas marina TaxID=2714601 RepID=A0A969WE90_9GAMM|nr:metallohydrolase [Solimonas marina]NKF24408.1 metallohydrolase [Solimonas marina]
MTRLSFFPVDNGDMTLVTTSNEKTVLIDCNIRDVTGEDPPPDVVKQLKERLKKDDKGRYYVDVFMLSHPDQDHCRGFQANFYCGPAADYPEKSEKIFIKELWSSPLIFRRKLRHETLCPDAITFNTEARRRVKKYRNAGGAVSDGDRILVLGEDEDNKQRGIEAIVVKCDTRFSKIAGIAQSNFEGYLLAPVPKGSEDEEEMRSKNNSSIIVQFKIGEGVNADACRFLTGGDADVSIWDRLWEKHKNATDVLKYDILLAPHHCSWHTLSHDSISDLGDKAKVSEPAKSALSQIRDVGRIVASCKEILDDDDDPPSHRAKEEYEKIADKRFHETSDFCGEPFEFDIKSHGPVIRSKASASSFARKDAAAGLIGSGAIGHG